MLNGTGRLATFAGLSFRALDQPIQDVAVDSPACFGVDNPDDAVGPEPAIPIVSHIDAAKKGFTWADLQIARNDMPPARIAGYVAVVKLKRALQRVDKPSSFAPLLSVGTLWSPCRGALQCVQRDHGRYMVFFVCSSSVSGRKNKDLRGHLDIPRLA